MLLKKFQLERYQTAQCVKELGNILHEEFLKIMASTPYSIEIDEVTKQYLGILLRYVDPILFQVRD